MADECRELAYGIDEYETVHTFDCSGTAWLLAHGLIDPRRDRLLAGDTGVPIVKSLLYFAVACDWADGVALLMQHGVALLMQHGADTAMQSPRCQGATGLGLLHHCMRSDPFDQIITVRYLLVLLGEWTADAPIDTNDGVTALMVAARRDDAVAPPAGPARREPETAPPRGTRRPPVCDAAR